MDPTVSRRFATLLILLSVSPCLAAPLTQQSQSTDGLSAIVAAALRDARPGPAIADELFRGLKGTVRDTTTLLRLPLYEQLVAVDRTGQIVASDEGSRKSVAVGAVLEPRLLRTDEHVLLIHNHPNGSGLSASDVRQLTQPGVDAVIAIGHDGSLYYASLSMRLKALQSQGSSLTPPGSTLPPRISVAGFLSNAWTEVGHGRRVSSIPGEVWTSHFNHVTALSMSEARAIDYQFVLGRPRQKTFDAFQEEIAARATDAARKIDAQLARLEKAR